MFKIDKILIFCLFFVFSINCYSQTTTNIVNKIPTNSLTAINFEIGGNYSGNKFGESARLSYELNKYAEIGIEGDYINGTLYQSTGNAKLGRSFDTQEGDIFLYGITGTGLAFQNKVDNSTGLITILGMGAAYSSPYKFKLFSRYESNIFIDFELDKYSNTTDLVFKQFIGFRIQF